MMSPGWVCRPAILDDAVELSFTRMHADPPVVCDILQRRLFEIKGKLQLPNVAQNAILKIFFFCEFFLKNKGMTRI